MDQTVQDTVSYIKYLPFLIVFIIVMVIYMTVYRFLYPPSVDCALSDWSSCDPTGNQIRTVLRQSYNNGLLCGPTSQSCSDCIMTSWTTCDKNGNQTRSILKDAVGTGKACPNIFSQTCTYSK